MQLRNCDFKCDYLLVNDAVLGLIAGTSKGWGIAIVSGTGCNVRGRDNKGNEGRILGYGMEWGESAGAIEVVQCALQHIGKQWTRRGPSTRITELFLEKMNAKSISELLEGYILQKYQIDPAMGAKYLSTRQRRRRGRLRKSQTGLELILVILSWVWQDN